LLKNTSIPIVLPKSNNQEGVAIVGDVDQMKKEEKIQLSTTLQNRAAIIGKKKTEVSEFFVYGFGKLF
jgi:predicted transcriptional regulator